MLNWLVAGGTETPGRWLAAGKPPADIDAAWEALAERHAPHLALAPLPPEPGTPVALPGPAPESLSALPPPLSIAPAWRIGSFSGLASDSRGEAAANDHDARIAEAAQRIAAPPPAIAPDDILRFPRGPSAGDCLHAIFERIDFTDPAGWKDAIAHVLSAHPQYLPGVRAAEQAPLQAGMAARMLADVMRTTLTDGIVLGAIPSTRRLTELEFSLPAPRVSAHAAQCRAHEPGLRHPAPHVPRPRRLPQGLHRPRVRAWRPLLRARLEIQPPGLRAVRLRPRPAAGGHDRAQLPSAIPALRAGRRAIPPGIACPTTAHDTHFGGVLYLFVRGVRPDWINADGTPAGVFHDRPSAATLARLDALFARASARAAP